MGIEAMFKDCQSGGYNLEGAKANETRLNNLILLIAISYTISSFKGGKSKIKVFKNIYKEGMKEAG
ncbi:hypothetical protein [Okeania sp. SIO2B3]|uniref:hypothetical protein n=1 Tax=Okeania sp. SIO2B3 TaxID=2607784 RepID=UPI0013C07631|nr:hypothetical protein [Okeania sp. SIO2B3]NET44708.1 hypothetical protein [Okeania sp. SIO2B3]